MVWCTEHCHLFPHRSMYILSSRNKNQRNCPSSELYSLAMFSSLKRQLAKKLSENITFHPSSQTHSFRRVSELLLRELCHAQDASLSPMVLTREFQHCCKTFSHACMSWAALSGNKATTENGVCSLWFNLFPVRCLNIFSQTLKALKNCSLKYLSNMYFMGSKSVFPSSPPPIPTPPLPWLLPQEDTFSCVPSSSGYHLPDSLFILVLQQATISKVFLRIHSNTNIFRKIEIFSNITIVYIFIIKISEPKYRKKIKIIYYPIPQR